jgi:gluconate 5-dehydrogenase
MSSIGTSLEKMFSLEGKVALLTGAAGGIGSELAKGLAAAGATMALCDIDLTKLAPVEAEIKAMDREAASFELNVLSKDSIKKCVDEVLAKFGHIDVLLNVAGINKREGVLDVAEDTYDRIMGINLKGTFLMSQEVVPHMIRAGKGGSVINIGSYNATSMLGGCAVYGATKSGVVALTRAMGNEWAKHNVRANCISPGHFWTPLTNVLWTDPVRSKYLLDRIAMGRPGKPGELVGLTVLLASDASSYMTGQAYNIDGGCLSGGQPWPYDTKW